MIAKITSGAALQPSDPNLRNRLVGAGFRPSGTGLRLRLDGAWRMIFHQGTRIATRY